MARIVGTRFGDLIDATHAPRGQPKPTGFADDIFGLGGNDSIHGLGGADDIFGGTGNDDIFGLGGDDLLDGEIGNDHVFGGDQNDEISGDIGDDTLDGGSGRDEIDGEIGNDVVFGGDDIDTVLGGGGDDSLDGGGDDDTILGNEDNDTIIGGAGLDKMTGGGGDDVFVVNAVSEIVTGEDYNGGEGIDRLSIRAGTLVDLSTVEINVEELVSNGAVDARSDQISAKDFLSTGDLTFTTAGNVFLANGVKPTIVGTRTFNLHPGGNLLDLTGNNSNYQVHGNAGADTVKGGERNDTLEGGGGHDELEGNGGDDLLIGGAGSDFLRGGEGNNVARFSEVFDNYNIFFRTNGALVVNYTGGTQRDGENVLLGISSLQFADGTASTDWSPKGGKFVSPNFLPQIGSTLLEEPAVFRSAGQLSAGGLAITGIAYKGDFEASQLLTRGYDFGDVEGDPRVIGPGLLLTNGDGAPPLSNTDADYSVQLGEPGDAALDAAALAATGDASFKSKDATVVAFNLNVTNAAIKFISFDVILGSEEWPSASTSDLAAIFVNGVNHALFDGEADRPLGVFDKTISAFTRNQSGLFAIEYNGVTPLLSVVAPVRQGANAIKLAIADLVDDSIDSGVFISHLQGHATGGTGMRFLTNGTAGANALAGTERSEEIRLGLGNDAAQGGDGNDLLRGEGGDDLLAGQGGDDVIDGGAGNDTANGGAGADVLAGGLGIDILNYASSSAAVNVILFANAVAGGDAGGDRISGFEGAFGSAFADKLTGDAGNNSFRGGLGADSIAGGAGFDTADYSAGGAVSINLSTATFRLAAAGDQLAGIERIVGSLVGGDLIVGGADRETLEGLGGNDRLDGGQGADVLIGGGGSDRLTARAGADTLNGAAGKDGLNGGSGNDRQIGGAGADSFIYDIAGFGADTIVDFEDGTDRIWFKAAVADAVTDFAITGNGTANVTLSVIGNPGQSIAIQGASPIVLTAADFVFFA